MGKNNSEKKQEVKSVNFSFGNISTADDLINKKQYVEKKNKISYLFRISKEYYNLFYNLKNERADFLKNYNEYNSLVFKIMLLFVKDILIEKGIFKNATELFTANVSRLGKRKKNKRSLEKENIMSLQIYLSNSENLDFLDCFYSFALDSPNENVNDITFSKNYFFYDIIDIVNANKKKFLSYEI